MLKTLERCLLNLYTAFEIAAFIIAKRYPTVIIAILIFIVVLDGLLEDAADSSSA